MNIVKSGLLIIISFALCFSCTLKSSKKVKSSQPNIIYILADDLGYGELGSYGQKKILTPHLDKMAEEGIRFTSHYSGQTVCSPSRCSLMTGKHMGHASVRRNGQLLNPKDTTVAILLKQAGYTTGAIGKWGLSRGSNQPNGANAMGFDEWFGYDNQGFAHFYYPEFLWRNNEKVNYPENYNLRDENGAYKVGEGTYSHDVFTQEAFSFIKRNSKSPFFLYLPYAIPHAELTVPEDSKDPYRHLNWPEKPKEEKGGGKKDNAGYGSQYTKGYCAQSEPNMTYAAMISRMDRDIGNILKLLDSLKLSENTLVIFSSDNGPSGEGGQDLNFFESSGELTGHKRSIYEGGIRIPLIAKWAGKIPEGVVSDHPSAFWDFLPTACDVAGVEIPSGSDGISFLPELMGTSANQEKHKYLYFEWNNKQGIRAGKWKLFRTKPKDPAEEPTFELYNLETDISEKVNLAQENVELINSLKEYIDEATSN